MKSHQVKAKMDYVCEKDAKHEDPKLLGSMMAMKAETVAEMPPTVPTTMISHRAIRSHSGMVLIAKQRRSDDRVVINCHMTIHYIYNMPLPGPGNHAAGNS